MVESKESPIQYYEHQNYKEVTSYKASPERESDYSRIVDKFAMIDARLKQKYQNSIEKGLSFQKSDLSQQTFRNEEGADPPESKRFY